MYLASQNISSFRNFHRNSIIGFFSFLLLVALMGILGTIVSVNALSRAGNPFPGFLYYPIPQVGVVGNPEWVGLKAGMQARDVILEINGKPIATSRDIEEIVKGTPVGESLTYVIYRRGEKRTLSIPVSLFSYADLVMVFGITFLMGFAFWGIGLVVFVLKPNKATTWAFLLGCFLVGMYLVTALEAHSNSRWGYVLGVLSPVFFPAAFIHLSFLFPEQSRLIEKYPKIPIAFYIVSTILFALHMHFFWILVSGPLSADQVVNNSSYILLTVYLTRLYIQLATVAIVVSGLIAYLRSSSSLAKQRARLVFFSSAVAFIPPTLIQGLTTLGKLSVPFNITAPFVVAFPAGIGFAIARHNLFDVDVYIKRTVGYVIMTGLVAGGYFALQTVFKTAVLDPLLGRSSEQVYPFLFAVLTVFAFNPVSRRVQLFVDKLFYRKGYDYKATVASVSDALTTLVDIQAFLTNVVQRIRQDMFVDRAGVIMIDSRQQTCQSLFLGEVDHLGDKPRTEKDPCLSPDDPLLRLLTKERKLITKYDVAEDPAYANARESCGRRFAELGVSLALPLFYRDEFAGMLALGYKKSGHFYSGEDIDLLKTVSTMTSTAIEHSREKGQREVLMQLFSKHVSPQVAETLWEQREQFLDGGRPKTQSLIVTAMFTDLQGFSTISETQDPEGLMAWLNTYMETVTTTVMEYAGVVDDFFGDGVKINFGVPIPRTTEAEIRQDAVNAVTCSLAMEQKMIALNAAMTAQGHQPLRMRVGIYTGPVVAGSLGSADRMKYTTIGDTVNTAARLESYDKNLYLPHLEKSPCRIIIGEATLRYLDNQFQVEEVGALSLKGKQQQIKAYCVVGRISQTSKASTPTSSR